MISNVGDSRAVMGTRDEDDHLTAIQLTVDLKPNLPGNFGPFFYMWLPRALANLIQIFFSEFMKLGFCMGIWLFYKGKKCKF